MNNSNQLDVRRKAIAYGGLFAALFLGYLLMRGSTWEGSTQLHTLMELAATLLALLVGILALVRFYTKKSNTYLFIGAGFLGTSFLDGYHAIVTSSFFDQLFPSPPASLIPWSWNASRMFLTPLCRFKTDNLPDLILRAFRSLCK